MILAVTLNPSIDISYPLGELAIGQVNRVIDPRKSAGGKGLNVARVAFLQGADVLATGMVGGSNGELIKKDLAQTGVPFSFLETEKESRNCIAILHDGKQTEILEAGPVFLPEEGEVFLDYYKGLLKNASVVTISGSLPRGLRQDFYSQMIGLATAEDLPVFLDCSGETLAATLAGAQKPQLIKPNEDEIAALLGLKQTKTERQLVAALADPIFAGVPWVVVSRGERGVIAKMDNRVLKITGPTIMAINAVGSGDAAIAGFATAFQRGETAEEMLKRGMASGLLNALEKRTGWINPALLNAYCRQMVIKEFDKERGEWYASN